MKAIRRHFLVFFCAALLVVHHLTGHGVDDARSIFAQVGYVTRYLAGQTPWLVRKVVRNGTLHLFHIGDFGAQQRQGARRIEQSVVPQVERTARRLVDAGVEVVLLPVPTKLSVERDLLPAKLPCASRDPGECTESADELFRRFRAIDQARTVDLLEVFRRQTRERGELVFPPNDYHWSSLGVSLAVLETARLLRGRGWSISEPVLLRDGESLDRPSYLTQQFLIPDWFYERRAELQWRSGIYRAQAKAQGAVPRRIVIAGTSFSNGTDAGSLQGQLQSIFSKPVRNFARANGGYLGSFEKMREEKFTFAVGDLLVWELPICCLNVGDTPIPQIDVAPRRSIASGQ